MGPLRTGRGAFTRAASVVVAAAVAALFAGCATDTTDADTPDTRPPASATTPTPSRTPLTPAQQLLALHTDVPGACAVSFSVDGATVDPQLQVHDRLFDHLPIPRVAGRVFAGWYPDAATAASASADPAARAGNPATRVNGSHVVSCPSHQITLFGAWTTSDALAAAKTRVPILMYHQFTTKAGGEDGWLRGNYSYIEDYRAQMQYIKDQAFYLPTWDELSAFIDGALYLPDHAVIITDDDADASWLTLASPINEQLQLMATSFVITGSGVPTQNRYVLPRSHTHNMHQAGSNGKGQMVNLSAAEIAADMNASAAALGGVKEVMAYPYGHNNETSREGLRQAGFEMARTIAQGYVSVGSDKLTLPCVRINYGMGVTDLKKQIG
ncbi:polysaccharide deacetylase family protein [Microbacterium sp. VKM Ac-2870]|uniref:polysaccharide deacetylase family protein n=1 Tax=Microbacterium sp. VKM Ac-2870 TaxID=2783825 RepID=UPI00188A52F3|nr:polysaccharide deacetylase family protein [Microbacterium sp. VKM Ac-2870]MBF4562768.1 polysaccharide deacetylase family protein [Microbacterium sp. VKM Ac-2870]